MGIVKMNIDKCGHGTISVGGINITDKVESFKIEGVKGKECQIEIILTSAVDVEVDGKVKKSEKKRLKTLKENVIN